MAGSGWLEMICLNLSKDFAKDMREHIGEQKLLDEFEQLWYAHRITLNHRKCVITMEEYSRYAMVFCGLTKKDFQHFPELFQERLWREVLAVVIPENDELMASLSDRILSFAQHQHYQARHDRSVSSHIRQAFEELDILVNYQGWGLPTSLAASIEVDLRLNRTIRKKGKSKDYFTPLEVFRDNWLIGDPIENPLVGAPDKPPLPPEQYEDSKVIPVDFTSKGK
jgi:Domain of unknown function (DUF6933)